MPTTLLHHKTQGTHPLLPASQVNITLSNPLPRELPANAQAAPQLWLTIPETHMPCSTGCPAGYCCHPAKSLGKLYKALHQQVSASSRQQLLTEAPQTGSL